MNIDDKSPDELREMMAAARAELKRRQESLLTASQEERVAALPHGTRTAARWLIGAPTKTLFWVAFAVALVQAVLGARDCGPGLRSTQRVVHEIRTAEALPPPPPPPPSPEQMDEGRRERIRHILED